MRPDVRFSACQTSTRGRAAVGATDNSVPYGRGWKRT